MNLLIDIGHPAHVHLYLNMIQRLNSHGHNVIVTVKEMDSAKMLLKSNQIPFIVLSQKSDNIKGKLLKQLRYNYDLLRIVHKHKIDLGVGSSITIAHVSRISKMKSIIFDDDDDEVQPLFVKYAHPFADSVVSPDAIQGKRKRKDTIFYAGYHELAYLHPNIFSPDPSVLHEIGINKGEPIFIMRFNVFKAHHDIGVKGLSLEQKLRLVNALSKKGKILITTEREIEPELAKYKLMLPAEKIHSLLYYATMFLGDSQTMASESAALGTPALKCNSFAGILSVPNEIENKYGLCFSYQPKEFDQMLGKISELLSHPNLKNEWQERRRRMLLDKIDVTAFMVWFVENYPRSTMIMHDNPDYQLRFK